MKLTTEQLRAITFGAARIEETETGLHFYRFTKEQEAYYQQQTYNKGFYDKTFSTAGIRLEFVTNSRTLAIETEVQSTVIASSRKFFYVTVFCNGEKLGAFGTEDTPQGMFGGTYTLPEGENTVCIYLPWSVAVILRRLSLDDGATLVPVQKTCKLIQFGDSITHGYDAHEPQNSYASIIADALGADARNKAIGGEIFQPALATLRDTDFDPDYITVAYGTNDWSHSSKKTFVRDCRAFYHNLAKTYPAATIFAITPIWRGQVNEERPMGPFSTVADTIRTVAAELPNVTVIDGYSFVPEDPACFSPDLLHPSDLGFCHYGKNLAKALKKHIQD